MAASVSLAVLAANPAPSWGQVDDQTPIFASFNYDAGGFHEIDGAHGEDCSGFRDIFEEDFLDLNGKVMKLGGTCSFSHQLANGLTIGGQAAAQIGLGNEPLELIQDVISFGPYTFAEVSQSANGTGGENAIAHAILSLRWDIATKFPPLEPPPFNPGTIPVVVFYQIGVTAHGGSHSERALSRASTWMGPIEGGGFFLFDEVVAMGGDGVPDPNQSKYSPPTCLKGDKHTN